MTPRKLWVVVILLREPNSEWGIIRNKIMPFVTLEGERETAIGKAVVVIQEDHPNDSILAINAFEIDEKLIHHWIDDRKEQPDGP